MTLKRGAPRVCGDDPEKQLRDYMGLMVLPAYAGMILVLSEAEAEYRSAPRVCGDDPTVYLILN